MFTCKDHAKKFTFEEILVALEDSPNVNDPTDTVWYIAEDESLVLVCHPHCGIVIHNDEMLILDIQNPFNGDGLARIKEILSEYDFGFQAAVWYPVGIDNIDYQKV